MIDWYHFALAALLLFNVVSFVVTLKLSRDLLCEMRATVSRMERLALTGDYAMAKDLVEAFLSACGETRAQHVA